jgi:hypothetical protein
VFRRWQQATIEWYAKDFLGVYNRRCAECHGELEGHDDWEGRFAWINFTNPRLSPALDGALAEGPGRSRDQYGG